MTDSDKINRLESINLLFKNIGLCFENKDHTFGSDKVSENYTKDLLKIAFDEGVSIKEWEELILGFLYNCSNDPRYIAEQTNIASMLYQKTDV
jgi:hypothetical protein